MQPQVPRRAPFSSSCPEPVRLTARPTRVPARTAVLRGGIARGDAQASGPALQRHATAEQGRAKSTLRAPYHRRFWLSAACVPSPPTHTPGAKGHLRTSVRADRGAVGLRETSPRQLSSTTVRYGPAGMGVSRLFPIGDGGRYSRVRVVPLQFARYSQPCRPGTAMEMQF